MKPRHFLAVRDCETKLEDGSLEKRKVVVVGEWKMKKESKEVIVEHNKVKMICKLPVKEYSLTLAKAICHPDDNFVLDYGVKKCLKRIKRKEDIGKLKTEEYTMLTRDNCQLIVNHKADFIADNILAHINKH